MTECPSPAGLWRITGEDDCAILIGDATTPEVCLVAAAGDRITGQERAWAERIVRSVNGYPDALEALRRAWGLLDAISHREGGLRGDELEALDGFISLALRVLASTDETAAHREGD